MKLRYVAVVVCLATTLIQTLKPAVAHAQAGIYLAPIAIRGSNSTADTGTFAFLGSGETSQMFYGVNLGGYYNLYRQERTEAGIDVRDTIVHGNNASLNSFLVGARIATSPFARPIKPYVQVSVGAGTSKPPTSAVHVTKVQFGAFVGADYTLNRHIDFRVIEVGYNSLQTVSSSTIGSTSATIPSTSLLSFSSGIVFRFP
jgi:hypothetical protein